MLSFSTALMGLIVGSTVLIGSPSHVTGGIDPDWHRGQRVGKKRRGNAY